MYFHFPRATQIGLYATARKQREWAEARTWANPAISVPASAELVPAQWRPWDELFLENLAEQGLSLHLFPKLQGPEQQLWSGTTRQDRISRIMQMKEGWEAAKINGVRLNILVNSLDPHNK